MFVCVCVLVLFMLFGLLRVVVLFVRCSVCLCVVSVDQWIRGSVGLGSVDAPGHKLGPLGASWGLLGSLRASWDLRTGFLGF